MKKFDLEFCRSEQVAGFRTLALSSFRDTKPEIIVRELIQNSVDAANTAKRKAKVIFQQDRIKLEEIPAIDSFTRAFEAAKTESKERGQTREQTGIINRIEESLKGGHVDVLWIVDNGIGLSTNHMNNLLAEGDTVKKDQAGSYGVGHLTSFPVSDLRYIIYGGCSDKERIISGHAILRSHGPEKDPRGPNGYIRISGQEKTRRMKFPTSTVIGGIWDEKIKQIRQEQGSGSFVCVLAFNFFNRDRNNYRKSILFSAATHFMPLVYNNELEVRCDEDEILNKSSLQRIIEEGYSKRNTSGIGVSGKKFFDMFQNLSRNRPIPIKFGAGFPRETGKVCLESSWDVAPTEINLYRNGMWITNKVPKNQERHFSDADYVPFNALVMVDNKNASRVGELITMSEGPTHIDMSLNSNEMDEKQKEELTNALLLVQKAIKDNAEIDVDNGIKPSNFLVLNKGAVGKPEVAVERRDRFVEKTQKKVKKKRKKVKRPGGEIGYNRNGSKRAQVRALFVLEGKKIVVSATAQERLEDVEVSFVRKKGSDRTCEMPEPDTCETIDPVSTIDGIKIAQQQHIPFKKGSSEHVGIMLETIEEGRKFKLVMELATPPRPGFNISLYDVEFIHPSKSRRDK